MDIASYYLLDRGLPDFGTRAMVVNIDEGRAKKHSGVLHTWTGISVLCRGP